MPVKAGQVLALLDDAEWKAQLDVSQAEYGVATRSIAEAEFSLKEAEKNLKRARELSEQGLMTEQDSDRADTNVSVWRARLAVSREQTEAAARRIAQAQRNLDNCTVRAPFAGVAVSKDAQVGEMVSPVSAGGGFTRTGISTVVNMASLEVEVDVNESYLSRVHDGQLADATLDAYPDWHIAAHVRTIIPTADRQKATVKVRIAFDALDPRILPDMGVKVSFLQPSESGDKKARCLVPLAALMESEGQQVVWVVKGGVIERHAVRAGRVIGKDVEILSGADAGDTVVVSALKPLKSGLKAEIKK